MKEVTLTVNIKLGAGAGNTPEGAKLLVETILKEYLPGRSKPVVNIKEDTNEY